MKMQMLSKTLHHAVVLDGYQWTIARYRRKYMLRGSDPVKYKYENYSINLAYAAVNWGWKGKGDRDTTDRTIWYNVTGVWKPTDEDRYSEFSHMIYGFSND